MEKPDANVNVNVNANMYKHDAGCYHYLIEGDSMFIDDEYDLAIEMYNKGLLSITNADSGGSYASDFDVDKEEFKRKYKRDSKILFLLFSHLCSAYLKIGAFQKAHENGKHAMEVLSTESQLKFEIGEKGVEALKKKLDIASSSSSNKCQAKSKQKGEMKKKMIENEDKMEKLVVEEIDTPKLKPKSKIAKVIPSSHKLKIELPTAPKYQYYQSDTVMTISLLEASVDPSNLSVQFFPKKLIVQLTKDGHTFTVIYGTLFETVLVDKCKVIYKEEKVLIKLKKKDKLEWHELFGAADNDDTAPIETDNSKPEKNSTTATDGVPSNQVDEAKAGNKSKPIKVSPYASKKDWNAVERDLKKQEAAEKPEGEEALNKLFQGIYGKSSADTRRAMVKSFQTSGGTVLSTNWNEVKNADYESERQAPKGMEWKNWEGKKLKQKD